MKQSLFDKIEAYLDNALSAEQKAEFEQALAEDPALAEALAVFELEREGRELLIEADLRKKLSQWNADENTDPNTALPPVGNPVKKKSPIWLFAVLSGLIVVCLLVWWYWPKSVPQEDQKLPVSPSVTPRQQDQQPIILQPKEKAPIAQVEQPRKKTLRQPTTPENNSGQLLAMTYYERSDLSDVLRGGGANQATPATPLQLAKDNFRSKKFSGAVAILEKILPDDPYYWQAQELLGHTFFRVERFAEAAKVFRKITDTNNNERGEMARWYLALSLLADGRSEEATVLLSRISEDAEPAMQEQAKALLVELGRR